MKKFDGYYQDNHFDSVLEIGAGYGRTCHGLLSNLHINEYTIIDLENMLEHSKEYLKSSSQNNQRSLLILKDLF